MCFMHVHEHMRNLHPKPDHAVLKVCVSLDAEASPDLSRGVRGVFAMAKLVMCTMQFFRAAYMAPA